MMGASITRQTENHRIERRALQVVVFLGGFVPVLAGLAGFLEGPEMAGMNTSVISMDSHFRYLSGLLMGIGFCFWSTILDIEMKKERFQMLGLIVVLGGCARLYSLITVGLPDHAMLSGLVMELVIVPLLVLWQHRVTHQTASKIHSLIS